jgi:DNA-directed RNA polymerase sigma subunit (sigma70/sigma32)
VTDDQDEVKPLVKVEYDPVEEHKKAMENISYNLLEAEDVHRVMKELGMENNSKSSVRDHNVGCSNYSKHKIQPWDIWEEYKLNPWDADIVKRVLREKKDGRPATVTRIEDYDKIIHVCQERIRQIQANGHV